MTFPRAHRVTVTPRPDGVDLDVSGYAADLLKDFLNLPTEQLVADLLAALPGSALGIRLHQPETLILASNLREIAVAQARPLPQWRAPEGPKQQDRRAS